jgi:hypothetical protein
MILRRRAFCPAPLSRTLKTQVRISRLFIVTGANFSSGRSCRHHFVVQIDDFISNNTPLKYSVSGIVGKMG